MAYNVTFYAIIIPEVLSYVKFGPQRAAGVMDSICVGARCITEEVCRLLIWNAYKLLSVASWRKGFAGVAALGNTTSGGTKAAMRSISRSAIGRANVVWSVAPSSKSYGWVPPLATPAPAAKAERTKATLLAELGAHHSFFIGVVARINPMNIKTAPISSLT
jgi:hypothetical protein